VAAVLVIFLGLALGMSSALAYPSNNVPIDNWAYEGLDKLAGFGLIHSDVYGMRPYTRLEVARLVGEALDTQKKQKLKLPSLIQYYLDKFKGEYRQELAYYGHGKGEPPADLSIKPLDEAEETYVNSQGRPQVYLNTNGVRQYPYGNGSIVGYEGTPLLPNNQGVVYGKGSNFAFQFASSFEALGLFSGYIEPIFLMRQNSSDGTLTGGTPPVVGAYGTSNVDLLTGYLKFSPSDAFELEVGRDSLWWGQGYTGTLVLTDNAAPLDMIKIANPVPIILPWYFSYLGPFQYSLFCAQLEADRDFPNTLLAGERVDFKPTPNLELGASQTVMFGGQGSPSPETALNYFELMSFYKLGGAGYPESHEAAFDFRYTMPCLWDSQFYGEWGGADTGFKPSIREFLFQDIGYILGLYMPRITPDGRSDLRLEYTDNVNEGFPGTNDRLWYTNSIYVTGYTYNGLLLGDPMGPDARQGFIRTTRYIYNDLKAGVDCTYTQRGANMGRCISGELALGADVTYDVTSSVSTMVRYAWGEIRNFDLESGNNQADNLFMLQVKYDY
jgi:hypothetical protein